MRSPKKDRRKSVRHRKRGMALLLPVNSDAPPIAGVLIDGGEGGFRAAHSCRRFTTASGRQFYPSIPGRRGSSDLESLGQVRILKPALSILTMPTPSNPSPIQVSGFQNHVL